MKCPMCDSEKTYSRIQDAYKQYDNSLQEYRYIEECIYICMDCSYKNKVRLNYKYTPDRAKELAEYELRKNRGFNYDYSDRRA